MPLRPHPFASTLSTTLLAVLTSAGRLAPQAQASPQTAPDRPPASPAPPRPGPAHPAPTPLSPTFWAERDVERLRVSVDVRPAFDASWRARLLSGLSCVVAVEIRLREHDGGRVRGRLRRILRVRWDLWAERMRREAGGEADFSTTEWPTLDAFLAEAAQLRGHPMGERIALDGTVYSVDAHVELNPWSIQAKALPPGLQGQPARPPTPEGMFDTLLHWAESWQPGDAERTSSSAGHPFRGDRLPTWRSSP